MKSLPILLLFGIIIFSCGDNDQKQKIKTKISKSKSITIQESSKPKGFSPDSDILTVTAKSAVFFQPDSFKIKKRIKQIGEQEFRTGADDYIYYINISAEYLEKQGLNVIDAKNKNYLRFVRADAKVKLIKLDTLPDLWGMYLFDPKKEPFYADIIDIETDYKNYFK